MGSKAVLLVAAVLLLSSSGVINGEKDSPAGVGPMLLTKENRKTLASSEAGSITAVDVRDGGRGINHLQFITMRPASLFLPVLLHADMMLYVHSGCGRISYFKEEGSDKTEHIDLERGDVYRIGKDHVFYVQSSPESASEELSLHAIFNLEDAKNTKEIPLAAYSSISELVRHFDVKVLQKAFGASEQTIQDIRRAENPQMIVNFRPMNEMEAQKWDEGVFGSLRGIRMPANDDMLNKKKKKKSDKKSAFNFYKTKPDVENCNGWSTILSDKDLKSMKETEFTAFMVNLTRGAMVGPHWNPSSTEIDIMIHGRGVVQVGCSSRASDENGLSIKCQEETFVAKEGDVLVVPEYRPVVQISYNNGSLVFVGLSSHAAKNRPHLLSGKKSLLQNIDRDILAMAFNTRKATVTDFLLSQGKDMLLECTSCAEELERKIEEKPEEKEEEEEEEEEEGEEEGGKGKEREPGEKREEEEGKEKEREPEERREEEGGAGEEGAEEEGREEGGGEGREESEPAERREEEGEEERAAREREEGAGGRPGA